MSFFTKTNPKKNIKNQVKTMPLKTQPSEPHVRKSKTLRRKEQSVPDEQAEKKESKNFFDKNKYRMQKYSKKYKLEQWEKKHRREMLKQYHKSVKKDETYGKYTPFNFDNVENENSSKPAKGKYDISEDINYVMHPNILKALKQKNKVNPFNKFKKEFEDAKDKKIKEREVYTKKQADINQAVTAYKEKKTQTFKKLSRKNKRGQPLMATRMQMLLDTIQKKNK